MFMSLPLPRPRPEVILVQSYSDSNKDRISKPDPQNSLLLSLHPLDPLHSARTVSTGIPMSSWTFPGRPLAIQVELQMSFEANSPLRSSSSRSGSDRMSHDHSLSALLSWRTRSDRWRWLVIATILARSSR